ncbi:MAG: M28 family metallopeptidase [Planctomycetota bacterium]
MKKLIPYLLLIASPACTDELEFPTKAADTIRADELGQKIAQLASDELEGRGPSSEGEKKTLAYLVEEYQRIGLEPAVDGTYFQDVPLVDISASPEMTLTITSDQGDLELAFGQDMMAWTKRVQEDIAEEGSELVFVGYGVVAPEYEWNDYEGLDVAGKTVVMLVNDPGFATQDEKLFNGNAMTYYGRWTYKFEEAARQGARGALIIHETDAAGYGWEVVSGSWAGSQFDLVSADGNASRCAFEGWLSGEAANRVLGLAGLDVQKAKKKALEKSFQPIPLGATASITIQNEIVRSTSKNVIGLMKGSKRPDEYIIIMAHWDHLGLDPEKAKEGDGIYNGAVDNASGVAGLLELAEAFSALEKNPERSILFAAVTAEESGLLGSKHYAENPTVPLSQIVAGLNMDGLNYYGATRDITVVGYGSSELEDYLREAAKVQNRVVTPEDTPEKGYYFRSDHFQFAKMGVPMLYTEAGIEHLEKGKEFGRAQNEAYTRDRYHKPSDEYDASWDLTGAVQDLELFFAVTWRLANEESWPNWYEGNAFRAIRDASRQ